MMDMLLEAEWDVQLATGWSCERLDNMPAERVLILHLRWQYNQMRYSGMMGFSGARAGSSRPATDTRHADRWKSQTIEHPDGRVTKRINIEDLWNPAVAHMVNNLGG